MQRGLFLTSLWAQKQRSVRVGWLSGQGIGLPIRRLPVRFQLCQMTLCPWARHFTLLASGECPCTYCKSLWIRASVKCKCVLLCTQRWCWSHVSPSLPGSSWRCSGRAGVPPCHPEAACQSEPSAGAAEKWSLYEKVSLERKLISLINGCILSYLKKLSQPHWKTNTPAFEWKMVEKGLPLCRRFQTWLQCPGEMYQ